MSDNPYELQSVRNALRVLLLLQQGRQMSVSEVALSMNLAMSTSHRILATLKAESFVRQSSETKKYFLGPVMASASSAHMIEDLIQGAREPMRRLVDATGESSHLMVRDGRVVRYIHVVDSPHLVRLAFTLEDTHPVHTIAAGKVLISHLSESELDNLLPNEKIKKKTSHSIGTRTKLKQELKLVRERGYAFNMSETELGLFVAAVPILDSNNIPIAAISLGGPTYRINEERMFVRLSSARSPLEWLKNSAIAASRNLHSSAWNESQEN